MRKNGHPAHHITNTSDQHILQCPLPQTLPKNQTKTNKQRKKRKKKEEKMKERSTHIQQKRILADPLHRLDQERRQLRFRVDHVVEFLHFPPTHKEHNRQHTTIKLARKEARRKDEQMGWAEYSNNLDGMG